MQRAKGLAAPWLSPQEALTREPHLSGRVVAGLLIDGDHQVDPRALGAALRTAIAALGGRLVTGYRV